MCGQAQGEGYCRRGPQAVLLPSAALFRRCSTSPPLPRYAELLPFLIPARPALPVLLQPSRRTVPCWTALQR